MAVRLTPSVDSCQLWPRERSRRRAMLQRERLKRGMVRGVLAVILTSPRIHAAFAMSTMGACKGLRYCYVREVPVEPDPVHTGGGTVRWFEGFQAVLSGGAGMGISHHSNTGTGSPNLGEPYHDCCHNQTCTERHHWAAAGLAEGVQAWAAAPRHPRPRA